MKFSSRAIYGMRAMLALARTHGQGSTFLKDIVEREGLPGTYLEQLMVPLRKSGLVLAVRGAKGGYTLAHNPAEISVLSILEALEGPMVLAECPSGSACCGRPETCALQDLWAEGSQALNQLYQGISLAALLERQRDKESQPNINYAI
ncbi:MAG: Rrf2 family transcriptional regulator [Holophaga sp.]|nr:Rrf2 family transcriptional regulator [Holophaga sp.]